VTGVQTCALPISESAFKGFARAFGKAAAIDPRRAQGEAPSTKGTLTA
jgi:imidazoleglycerol-phosphate dehydratase